MMAKRGLQPVHITIPFLVFICSLTITLQVPLQRTAEDDHKDDLKVDLKDDHIILKRSHPSESLQQPHNFEDHQTFQRERHHLPIIYPHIPQGHNPQGHDPQGHNTEGHEGHRGHIQGREEDRMREALEEEGLTRVIFEEETFLAEDDYYDQDDNASHETRNKDHFRKKMSKKVPSEREDPLEFPKKHAKSTDHKGGHESGETSSEFEETEDDQHVSVVTTYSEDKVTEPSIPSYQAVNGKHSGKDNPIVLPVTTEGKTNGVKQKTEDPLIVYGFPKELLPIMPGGGSRFEDVEREKLEKKKMSQTKGGDDDSAENGGSHEAEGLYSSASLSSISLCFYWLMSFHYIDRILLL